MLTIIVVPVVVAARCMPSSPSGCRSRCRAVGASMNGARHRVPEHLRGRVDRRRVDPAAADQLDPAERVAVAVERELRLGAVRGVVVDGQGHVGAEDSARSRTRRASRRTRGTAGAGPSGHGSRCACSSGDAAKNDARPDRAFLRDIPRRHRCSIFPTMPPAICRDQTLRLRQRKSRPRGRRPEPRPRRRSSARRPVRPGGADRDRAGGDGRQQCISRRVNVREHASVLPGGRRAAAGATGGAAEAFDQGGCAP